MLCRHVVRLHGKLHVHVRGVWGTDDVLGCHLSAAETTGQVGAEHDEQGGRGRGGGTEAEGATGTAAAQGGSAGGGGGGGG